MTFFEFEQVVKEKHPKLIVYKHGVFTRDKIDIVLFNPRTKTAEQYEGTCWQVLNKLGIKAFCKHRYKGILKCLERNKKDGIMNETVKTLIDIKNDVETNYIIM